MTIKHCDLMIIQTLELLRKVMLVKQMIVESL